MATDIMASNEPVLSIFFNRSGWINVARSWFSNHGSWRNEVVQSLWLALIFLCLLFSDLPGVLQMNHIVIKGKTDSGFFLRPIWIVGCQRVFTPDDFGGDQGLKL